MSKSKLKDVAGASESPAEPVREMRSFETFRSFCKRHGRFIQIGEEVEFRPGVWNRSYLCEDGARFSIVPADPDSVRFGGQEPPTDPVMCLHARSEFVAAMLKREQTNYDNFLQNCRQQAHDHAKWPLSVPPPPTDWKMQLYRGEQRMLDWKNQLDEIEAELDATDPERIMRAKRAEADAQAREEARHVWDELMAYGGGRTIVGGGYAPPSPM
jgi:hypothetical protein